MRKWKSAGALALWVLAVIAGTAAAQDARTCRVGRAATPPKLDGALDAPCWKAASWQSDFTLLGAGEAAAQQTEFAMLWDDKFLYVGLRVHEPAMDTIKAGAADKDAAVFKDDHIEIFFRPGVDGIAWRQLGVNAAGARAEYLRHADGTTTAVGADEGTEIEWRCAAKRLAQSWQAEIAVPLTMLHMEPRQGATVAGNVARSRWEGANKANSTWTPISRNNFMAPAQFGMLTLSAAGGPETAPARRETVTTSTGDRFIGTVLGTAEGEKGAPAAPKWLRLQGRQFKDPVAIDLSLVMRIEANVRPSTPKGARITLTGGDYVLGEVKSITAEKASLVSCGGDAMTFPVADLSSVTMAHAESDYIESTFDSDDMTPWVAVRGKWTVSNNLVQLGANPGNEAILAVPVLQKGAITFAGDFEPAAGWGNQMNLNFEVILFGGHLNDQANMRGLVVNFWSSGYQVTVAQPGGGRAQVMNQQLGQNLTHVRLRVAFDPGTGQGRIWVNDAGAGATFRANGVKTGTHVAIGGWQPFAAKRLAVMPGIVSPGEEWEPASEDGVRISLVNGDSVTARSLALDNGRFTIQTAFGELNPDPGRVSEFRYLHKAKPPPALSKFVRIQAADCRLTFDSCEIFEDRVVARSARYGAVTLKRDSIRWIQFENGGK